MSKKKKSLVLFSSLLAMSMSVAGLTINGEIFSSKSNNLITSNSINSKQTTTDDVSGKELRAEPGTAYSDSSSGDGYFIYDKETSDIEYISFFGNLSWTYNVAKSEFIKRNIGELNPNQITYLKMKFNSSRNRIIVYGVANNYSFLFQMNTDGTEYFLNSSQSDDKKYENSFLTSKNNKGIVSNVLQLSVLSDITAVSLPSDTINDTKQINTYRVDLDSYVFSPITINLQGYTPYYSTKQTGNNLLDNDYKANQFISIQNFTDTTFLLLFSVKKPNNNDVYFSALVLDLNFSWSYRSDARVNCWPIGTNSNPTDYPDVFNLKFTKTENGNYLSVLIYQISPLEGDVKTGYKTYFLTNASDNRVRMLDETNYRLNGMSGLTSNNVCASDIIFNPYTNNFYIISWAKLSSGNKYRFFMTLLDNSANSNGGGYYSNENQTVYYTIKNEFEVANATYYQCVFMPILDSTITTIWNISSLFSIYAYDNSKNLIDTTNTKIWTATMINKKTTVQAFALTNMTDAQQAVNGYEPFKTTLPQDVTIDELNNLIYLHSSLNTNRIYESQLLLDEQNPLSYDNNLGTLWGTVKLRLTKWWIKNPKSYITYSLNLDLKNFATISTLSFQLVVSNGIDNSKWNNILNLKAAKYPSEVTKKEILDNFILKGDAININENNIKFDNESVATPLITVKTNNDSGTLTISYDLTSISSASMIESNVSGEYAFTGFKSGEAYEPISLNSVAYSKLMSTKLPFQVTKEDVLNCLSLSSGYSISPENWEWTPTHSENTKEFMDDQISGTLYGKIKYLKTSDFGNVSVPESTYTLTLDNTNSAGFINMISYLSNSVYFNQRTADGLAGAMSKNQVTKDYFDVIKQSTTISNTWFNINDIVYTIDYSESNDDYLTVTMVKPTNLNVTINGSQFVFNADWINLLLGKLDTIFGPQKISFNYGYINYSWNYEISNSNANFEIEKLLSTSNSQVQEEFKNIEYTLPSDFINNFYDENSGNFNKFQDTFNLLDVPNVSDTSSIYYFEIKSVQLVAYNSEGTLTANYIINYPNVGSSLNGGTNVYPSIKITGFKKDVDNTIGWLIPLIASLVLIMLITAIIILVRKSKKDKFLYSKNPKMRKVSIKYAKKIKRH